jgi:hypothetical protein
MFRSYGKAAVIAAVAASCGYAGAATISVSGGPGGTNVSAEGAAVSTSSISFGVNVNMASFQSRDNVIRLSLGGLSSARFATFNASAPSVVCKGPNGVGTPIEVDVTQNASRSSTWDFGISLTSGTTSNASCAFTSLAVVASTLGTGTLTVQSAVKRVSDSDFTYDTATAANVLTVSSQITSISVLSALNGVVDYTDQQGLGFDDTGADTASGLPTDGLGYADNLVIRVASQDGMILSTASALTFTLNIEAESGKTFAWLDSDSDRRLNNSTSTGRISQGTSVTLDVDQNTITFVSTGVFTGTSRDFTVSFAHKSRTPSTGIAISPMTFAPASATVSTLTNNALTVGSWTSNGTTVKIPYMPINTTPGSAKIDPIIVLTNRSSVTGTVTVNIVNARGESCTGSLGTISAGQTKSLGGAPLRAVLAGCSTYSAANGESLNISLTATLPASTTELFTGYNADTGRVTVVNSLNGKQ